MRAPNRREYTRYSGTLDSTVASRRGLDGTLHEPRDSRTAQSVGQEATWVERFAEHLCWVQNR